MVAAGFGFVSKVPNVGGIGNLYTFSAHNVISGLAVVPAARDLFSKSLGLLATGNDALNAVTDWGSVTSDMTFTVREVPEPSTYALMGLGLVGISLVARRRAAK
jgi:Zn-dependent alcohol dehydrogenase